MIKFKFNKPYFIYFTVLLIIEVLIAAFLKDGFIRHTFGDYLVVILMYCFVSSFIKTKPIYIAIGVLAFAFIVEFLQHFKLLEALHLQNNNLAKLILGSTFHSTDLIAYSLGFITVLIVEYKIKNK